MAINLPPDLEASVKRHLSSGQYDSAEEVLRAALGQFDEMDIVNLRRSVEDEAHGKVTPLDQVAEAIRRRLGYEKRQ